MGNLIDSTGLTTKTLLEIRTELVADFKAAYGDDINVDQDTPDGQAINIFSLAVKDTLDFLTQVYNSFNPDLAIGRVLDQRVAFNGIQRLEGTHTVAGVLVETDRAVNLVGLNDSTTNMFTVSDTNGNYFYLQTSQTIASSGFHELLFQAKDIGAIETTLGTMTKIITPVLGVKSVTNSLTIDTQVGLDEETDASLRARRVKSVSLSSQGYLAGLLAAIKNINGVTYAEIYENFTNATDSDSIPAHSIWAIVEGGTVAEIGAAIYQKRSAGCGMKGSVTANVTQPDGTVFQVSFDRTVLEPIYIKFDATAIDNTRPIDSTFIKEELVALLSPDVNQSININDIASLIKEIDSNCLATSILLSKDNATWTPIIYPSAKNKRFSLSTGNVAITVL